MSDFIQRLTEFVLKLQNKLIKTQNIEKTHSSYSNKSTKKIYSYDATLEFTSKTEKIKNNLELNAEQIIKKCKNNPENLLKFIQKNGTNIYRIPFAKKFLNLIHFEEGFITETKGLKALYLNLITGISVGKINCDLSTKPMFILSNTKQDIYQTIHSFYKWYSYKNEMPGFNSQAQDDLQQFLTSSNNNIKDLEINEILELKEAIARDVDAVNFVIKIAKSSEGAKNVFGKMKLKGASV